MCILNQYYIFYPIFKTRLASARKSARLVPIRERQNTAMSTEPPWSGTCSERMCVLFSSHHRDSTWISKLKPHTHAGHVTDCDKLTGSCQVEAVHFVLHTACYFTVTTTKVCNHQRGRSEINNTLCVCNHSILNWKEQLIWNNSICTEKKQRVSARIDHPFSKCWH